MKSGYGNRCGSRDAASLPAWGIAPRKSVTVRTATIVVAGLMFLSSQARSDESAPNGSAPAAQVVGVVRAGSVIVKPATAGGLRPGQLLIITHRSAEVVKAPLPSPPAPRPPQADPCTASGS